MTVVTEPGAVPWPCDADPEIGVSVITAAQAAEVLALIGELIRAEPPVFPAISRFLDARGAGQLPATEWLLDAISGLAADLGSAVENAGFSIDRTLPRFQRPGRTR